MPAGGHEDDEEDEPDILKQVDRVRRGLPPREPKGILVQVDRIRKGLPPREPKGILAQAQRKIREAQEGWTPPWRPGRSQDRNDPREIRLGALEYGEDAGLWGQPRADDASWLYPIPDDKVTTSINLLPPRRGEPPAQPPELLVVRRARERHWRLERATATAEPAATLEGLAEAITGNRADYKLLDFKRDPRTLRVGDKVNVMPLLEKAAGKAQEVPGLSRPTSLRISDKGIAFMKGYETLVLYPYDDRDPEAVKTRLTRHTGKATIGYGHLIRKEEWDRFKNGLTRDEAEKLFISDLKTKGEHIVRRYITAQLSQQQYDALVIFAFNIGEEHFRESTVRKMINDPQYQSELYKDLESAWKAFDKSGGKVNRGVINRRADEWEIYTSGDYRRNHW